MNQHQVTSRTLGPTGLQIPAVGFGTWRYSGGVTPLNTAIDNGAAFIDTAETYGSEEVVGEAIRGRRQQVFVASKVRPANFRKSDLIKAADGSLRRLSTDYIDLYQLHWPNYLVPIEETMSAMSDLVDSGKIRFVGVSNFSEAELKAAQSALGKHPIVSNQVRYSLIERTIESGLLQYCQQRQITVLAFSPFGENFSALQRNDPQRLLHKVASKYGKSEAQVALNWLLLKDNVVAIPKASTPEHVLDDCGARDWGLDAADADLLSHHIRYKRRNHWERFARRYARRVVQKLGRSL